MEDVLTQLTRQFLPQMTAAEKSRALRSLKAWNRLMAATLTGKPSNRSLNVS